MSDVERVLSALNARPRRDYWVAKCPAHDDRRPSLWIKRLPSGRLWVECRAGCNIRSITQAVGLPLECYGVPKRERVITMRPPQIVATYNYTDDKGNLAYQSVRYDPKDFRFRRPDPEKVGGWIWNLDGVTRYPYNLVEIVKKPDMPVFIVEGEKDVETMRSFGLVATTNDGGAGKWPITHGWWLQGRRVAIIPDKDRAGDDHALQVAASLLRYCSSIRIVYLPLPDKGDVTDFFNNEAKLPKATQKIARANFLKYVREAPEWRLVQPEAA